MTVDQLNQVKIALAEYEKAKGEQTPQSRSADDSMTPRRQELIRKMGEAYDRMQAARAAASTPQPIASEQYVPTAAELAMGKKNADHTPTRPDDFGLYIEEQRKKSPEPPAPEPPTPPAEAASGIAIESGSNPEVIRQRLTQLLLNPDMYGLFKLQTKQYGELAIQGFINTELLPHLKDVIKDNAESKRIALLDHLYVQYIKGEQGKLRTVQLNEFMDRVFGEESGKKAVVNWDQSDTMTVTLETDPNTHEKNPNFAAEWKKVPQLNAAQRLGARIRNVFSKDEQPVPKKKHTTFEESVVGANEQQPSEKRHTLRKLTYAGLAVLLLTVGGYKALSEPSAENSQQNTPATAQTSGLSEAQATSVITGVLSSEDKEIIAKAVEQGSSAEVSIGPDGVTVKTEGGVALITPGEVDKMIEEQKATAEDAEEAPSVAAESVTSFERGETDRADLTDRVAQYVKPTELGIVEESVQAQRVSLEAIVDSFEQIIKQARAIDPGSQTTVQKLFLRFADTNEFVTNSEVSLFLVENVTNLLSVNVTLPGDLVRILDARWQANHPGSVAAEEAAPSQVKIDEIAHSVVESFRNGDENSGLVADDETTPEPVVQQSEKKEEQSFLQHLRAEDAHYAEKEAILTDSMVQKLESESLYMASTARQMFMAIVEGRLSPEKNEEARALLELIRDHNATDFNADDVFGWLNRELSVQFPGYMKCYLRQLKDQGQFQTLVNTLRFLADGTNRPRTWVDELLTRLDYKVDGTRGSSQQLIDDINALANAVESKDTDAIESILAHFGLFTQPVEEEWKHLLGQ
jgi:hypothetical protein